MVERRAARRRTPAADQPGASVRFRRGGECRVVNVSHSGALIEGPVRLEPGRQIDATLVSRHGPVTIRVLVMRACVADLRGESVTYQAAIRFERPLAV